MSVFVHHVRECLVPIGKAAVRRLYIRRLYIRIRRDRSHQKEGREFAGRWERFREREIS